MTVRAPTREFPQPVVLWPGWVWWRDKHGYPHARRGVLEVAAATTKFTALLDEIRRAEGGDVAKAALDMEREGLEARFPHREVWWLPEMGPGNGRRITWHSRVRGEMSADVHAGSAGDLAAHIERADSK